MQRKNRIDTKKSKIRKLSENIRRIKKFFWYKNQNNVIGYWKCWEEEWTHDEGDS